MTKVAGGLQGPTLTGQAHADDARRRIARLAAQPMSGYSVAERGIVAVEPFRARLVGFVPAEAAA